MNALIHAAGEQPVRAERVLLPRWTRSWPARAFRFLFFQTVIIPLFRGLLTLKVDGIENLRNLNSPVLFASNHQSDLDTPAISGAAASLALSRGSGDVAGLFPQLARARQRFAQTTPSTMVNILATGIFNAYPLPQRMAGVRRALKYTGELIDEGYCPLVYPEGKRTPDGTLQPF